MRKLLISFILGLGLVPPGAFGAPVLKVGVTLHPYYSWTTNIAGIP